MAEVAESSGMWKSALLDTDATIEDAIRNLVETGLQIVMVTDKQGALYGTVTDGDIRRGLLRGLGMQSSIMEVAHVDAFVVPPTMDRETVRALMKANHLSQMPVVDLDGRIVGLHLWDNLSVSIRRENLMVIMAGGMGTRMRPHTERCPKPLLPVAGRPMLEHIIERARDEGFSRFILAVHYLGNMIEDYFSSGERWNVKIEYLKEDQPLGTAGALGLLKEIPDRPIVVTNGDVLTDVSYGRLLDFHHAQSATATMAVRLHEWQHPFGVVHTDGLKIVGFEEKPIARSHVNAGIYAISPEALQHLQRDERCDMPTLFERIAAANQKTVVYPMHEPWLDVGRPGEYEQVQHSVKKDS